MLAATSAVFRSIWAGLASSRACRSSRSGICCLRRLDLWGPVDQLGLWDQSVLPRVLSAKSDLS